MHTLLLAVRPLGCVGAECFGTGRGQRESEDIAWILLVAVALLTVAIASDLARRVERGRRLRLAALVLYGCGAALLVVGLIVNRGSSTGAPLWWLHDSDTLGRLLPVLGTLAFGLGLLRAGADRVLAWAFVVAALLGFAFNAQDWRALLSVPIGLVWIAFGLFLLARPDAGVRGRGRRRPRRPHR